MKHTPEEIKNRLSNIGEAIGGVALEYIADLEQENKVLTQNLEDTEIVNKALEKENAELKEKYVKECEDVAYVITNYNKQFTKAKEIIKDLMCFIGGAVALHDCKRHKDIDVEKLKAEAEQFLNEVEK